MSLVGLFIFILVVALVYWLVTLLPLPQPFKTILMVILILICILWLLGALGVVNTGLRIR